MLKPWEKLAEEIAKGLSRIHGPISSDNIRWIADTIYKDFPLDQEFSPTPDTGIGQGEAVKLAIEALEMPHSEGDFDTNNNYHCPPHCEACALIPKALAALKASSAPALKQEACGECGGDGIGRGLQGEKVAGAGPCESCGGFGKETKC